PIGKIDRKALPKPDIILNTQYTAPFTETEEKLAVIWKQVLKIDRIGIYDNFFELGGDSILSIQIVSKARGLDIHINPRDIFAHQTISELAKAAKTISEISADQGMMPLTLNLDNLTKEHKDNISDIYPLTPMQEGMLFHTLYAPETGNYFEQMHFLIKGNIDISQFQKAWQYMIDRYEILRTGFVWNAGDKPVQIVFNKKALPWEFFDWQNEDDENKLKELLINEQKKGFDLSNAPLIRCQIIQLSKDSYRFVLNSHHMLMDGWSMPIFFNELILSYQALVSGKNPLLPKVNQFKDYIAWLNKQDHKKAKSYWDEQLKGFETPTSVGIAKFSKESPKYKEYSFDLSKDITNKLQSLSRKHRITLNTMIQGAWGILLYRYSGNDDIVFGVTVSGRNVPISGIDNMLGLFINTLPLRVKINEKESLVPWLVSIQNNHQENNSYAYYGLSDIQSLSQIPKGIPLFESIVAFENYPVEDKIKSTEISFFIEDIQSIEYTNYPLTLAVIAGEKLNFKLSYDSKRFEEDAIFRLTKHLKAILEHIVKYIDLPVSKIPILTDHEVNQFITWNNTYADYPKDKTIIDLFEEQAEKSPYNTAVIYEEDKLTYKQLNEKANQLANYLIDLGVKPDTLVGICIERSLEMIIGLLGILKAGGAYVPIDPNYPKERIDFMIKDSNTYLVLSQDKIKEILSNNYSSENLKLKISQDNLAYVIYTSGSTGIPKGVMIPNNALFNHMFWMQRCFPLTSDDIVLQKTSFTFDASVWEFWAPLCFGAKLLLAKPEGDKDIDYLVETINTKKITVLQLVPSLFQILLEHHKFKESTSLKRVFCGGERLPDETKNKFYKIGMKASLYNLYGPTEATIDASYFYCDESETVSIGKPISNTQIYIFDKALNHVPIGVSGEIHIGGLGLARGYLNLPDLTKERFIETSFGRLYKTGDLGKFLPDGNIEYIGRIDNQVKLRGFRIELGEIESILCRHPNVRESAVILSDGQLIAYITGISNDLKAYLKTYLPDYMVPSSIIVLSEMPLTPNGKIDRKALPKLDIMPTNEYIAPFTEIEQKLAKIWEQVLKVDRVGIYDNFFELGGDSILSIQIVSKAREFDIHINPRDVFEHQTIHELAKTAKNISEINAEQGIIKGNVPLTPIQHYFFEQKLITPWNLNQAVLLTLPYDTEIDFLRSVLKEIIKHHDALRLRFRFIDNNWEQNYCESFEDIPVYLEEKTFNLEHGPIMQMVLFENKHLLWSIHHLAVDGVSWRILLEDFENLCLQLKQGKPFNLPKKTSSFKAWSEKLYDYALKETCQNELNFWRKIPEGMLLPLDHQGENSLSDIRDITVVLDQKYTDLLLKKASLAYHTQINDLLLCALAFSINEWTGKEQILIDLEGHGRVDLFSDMDLSRTVGWFTSIYPVSLELPARKDLDTSIKNIKEQLRRIPNEGIGYGIFKYLAKAPLNHNSSILFNYLGQFNQIAKDTDAAFGQTSSIMGTRSHILDFNSSIYKGSFSLTISYSCKLHEKETIEKLGKSYISHLTKIINHCIELDVFRYTPSDFPYVKITQAYLDNLIREHGNNISDIYPLTPMQEGMLFHSLYAPETGNYFEQMHFLIKGNIDISQFQRAWQYMIDRYEIFRTGFVWNISDKPM
ncbi:MAG: amino acid adenylation domain-containing protein, partial [Desulfobacterales bacterium]|nr:amino acid adenylation domain-containing protein [Desulfobacterales bacterium]